ncbi:Chloramphenicol O-acetyltransferase [Rhodopirellula sallentina SM41]|uniref:Chloramphenicol O-acetyltransferase n=1 Tax=Rhodopirellula sallentina SM41 TaxID=1263870 RepID=M5U171_9BACT|nr:Chloramphenicol O-acetyltransferase [Rhodopirellula sallentina SM41]
MLCSVRLSEPGTATISKAIGGNVLDPKKKHPMVMPDGTVIKTVVHLNQVIDHPRMEIGDFTYFGHLEELSDYASYLAPFLFPLSPERLVIGKFCQIAHGVRIITSSANHSMRGFSTYPFNNFRMSKQTTLEEIQAMFQVSAPKGDTVIGNDVWIGMEGVVMPGVTIGDGAIVGARSIVAKDVAPYSIVTGNPAKPARQRFDDEVIASLLQIRWWDWPTELIESNLEAITGANISALQKAAAEV